MDILRIVDLATGIVFIFLLVSTLCSAIREGIEAFFKTRAAYLERGIRALLDDKDGKGLTTSLLNHPLLYGQFLKEYVPKPLGKSLPVLANGRGLPSYIPARSFALALLDIAARGPATDAVSSDPSSPPMTVQSIRERLLNIDNPGVRRVLLTALDTSRGDLDLARKSLEDWFNSSMDRVSGWYKRSTQWVLLVVALVVTVGVNVDTLALADFLYHDPAARSALVTSAESATKQAPSSAEAAAALEKLDLPIGWKAGQLPKGTLGWFNRSLGWLITALAAMLGAPFWFDVLNRTMMLRSTLKPTEKNPEASSQGPPLPGPGSSSSTSAISGGVPSESLIASDRVLLPRDPGGEADGCGQPHGEPTRDEELPAAIGGVEP